MARPKLKPAPVGALWPADEVKRQAVAELVPYAGNARTHSDSQVAQVAESIKAFGFTVPVLIDPDGGIIAGHCRVMAAKLLGLADVPVMVANGWTDAQKRAYVIADNKLAANGGWDDALLRGELEALRDANFDLGLTGFDAAELAGIFDMRPNGFADPDDAPAAPAVPVSALGDLWILGRHRLLCGDATVAADVDKLLGVEVTTHVLADLVFTDPPYNVGYSGRGRNDLGTIKNDALSDDEFTQFIGDALARCCAAMKPLACIYVCHPDSQSGPKIAFEVKFAEHFKKSSTIIWLKQSAGMGWQDYRAQHEPILYGWKEGKNGKHFFCGDRAKTTVWNIGRDSQQTYKHPTQKPTALALEAIQNSSRGSDVVLDPFSGSGSTLIACEQSGRIGRLMELDAKYCDVAIIRWQTFTGLQATLDGDGRTFSQIASERAPAVEQAAE